jgi:hypothetical protein
MVTRRKYIPLAKKVTWNSVITLSTMETIIMKIITETIGTMTALIATKINHTLKQAEFAQLWKGSVIVRTVCL